MQLDAVLEVMIGLIMAWIVVSAATSQFHEFISDLLEWRAKFLKKRILEMFKDEKITDAVKKVYDHSLIQSLRTTGVSGNPRQPDDIPKQTFAQVVAELYPNIYSTAEKQAIGLKEAIGIRRGIVAAQTKIPKVLNALMPKQDVDGTQYLKNIEDWFDAKMKGASTIYRKNVITRSLVIGIIIAIAFNVDSIYIANTLWKDPTLRQAIVAQTDSLDPNSQPGLSEAIAQINALSIPIGWGAEDQGERRLEFLGWLITGFAAAQGAPFWFDILRNLTGLKKSESSQKPKTD